MRARSIARAVGSIAAAVWVALLLWVSITGLLDATGDAWFYLLATALTPTLVAMGVVVPDLLTAHGSTERDRVLFAAFPAACTAATLFGATVALGAAIGGWEWILTCALVGLVVAAQEISTMRYVRRALAAQRAGVARAARGSPTRRQVVLAVGKNLTLVLALFFLGGASGYALLGSTGLIIGLGLAGAWFTYFVVEIFRAWRQWRAAG